MQEMEEMNVADNCLGGLPTSLAGMDRMKELWIYGNKIQHLPDSILRLRSLECKLFSSSNSTTG